MLNRRNFSTARKNPASTSNETGKVVKQDVDNFPQDDDKKGLKLGKSRLFQFLIGFTSLLLTGFTGYLFLSNGIQHSSHSRRVAKKTNPKAQTKSPLVENEKIIKDSPKIETLPIGSDSEDFSVTDALKQIDELKESFYERYGGKDEANDLLRKGVFSFGDQSEMHTHMGHRFLQAAAKNVNVKFSFGGYSVTVGRGNHFSQSYPFVVQRVLSDLISYIWDIKLDVQNAAIGGIPSLPYGWCLKNFLGDDSDLVSWDYGMNEGSTTHALESYLRHSMTLLNKPMFLMLDVNVRRKRILEGYVKSGAIVDPVAINKDKLINPRFLKMSNEERPEGYKDWDKWGSPNGSPGQSRWHPKYKEHELLGWMIAMHILDGIKAAVEIMQSDEKWKSTYEPKSGVPVFMENVELPAPISKETENGLESILYGNFVSNDEQNKIWRMNHVSCRTSFLPVVAGKLDSIVVSGTSKVDEDPMKERDEKAYKNGWVMDIGKVERDTKRKVEKVGGMGYIDMKLALYGIPESGTLRLWLPYEGEPHPHKHDKEDHENATHYFSKKIIICEVNEKRQSKFHECDMKSDVSFTIGGEPSKSVIPIKSVASYLGKNICIQVEIPPDAKITKKADLQSDNITELSESTQDDVGLTVDINVTGKNVSRNGGPCSISHVIWEHL